MLALAALQAQRSAEGRIVIFRPDRNAARMAAGADRMCMPEVPDSMFIDAVKQVQAVSQLEAYLLLTCKTHCVQQRLGQERSE